MGGDKPEMQTIQKAVKWNQKNQKKKKEHRVYYTGYRAPKQKSTPTLELQVR